MNTEHRPGGHGKPKECACGEKDNLIYKNSSWQCPRCAYTDKDHHSRLIKVLDPITGQPIRKPNGSFKYNPAPFGICGCQTPNAPLRKSNKHVCDRCWGARRLTGGPKYKQDLTIKRQRVSRSLFDVADTVMGREPISLGRRGPDPYPQNYSCNQP